MACRSSAAIARCEVGCRARRTLPPPPEAGLPRVPRPATSFIDRPTPRAAVVARPSVDSETERRPISAPSIVAPERHGGLQFLLSRLLLLRDPTYLRALRTFSVETRDLRREAGAQRLDRAVACSRVGLLTCGCGSRVRFRPVRTSASASATRTVSAAVHARSNQRSPGSSQRSASDRARLWAAARTPARRNCLEVEQRVGRLDRRHRRAPNRSGWRLRRKVRRPAGFGRCRCCVERRCSECARRRRAPDGRRRRCAGPLQEVPHARRPVPPASA